MSFILVGSGQGSGPDKQCLFCVEVKSLFCCQTAEAIEKYRSKKTHFLYTFHQSEAANQTNCKLLAHNFCCWSARFQLSIYQRMSTERNGYTVTPRLGQRIAITPGCGRTAVFGDLWLSRVIQQVSVGDQMVCNSQIMPNHRSFRSFQVSIFHHRSSRTMLS